MKSVVNTILGTLFVTSALIGSVSAQSVLEKSQPLEITAEQSLEWHRNEKFFKASKNVIAVQGETKLSAQILIARYHEDDGKDTGLKIYLIEASGGVVIDSAQSKAYGEKAVFEVDKGVATMTGGNLRLVSQDQTVTAKESFRYWVREGRLMASGKAMAIRGEDRLEAENMSATFAENKDGSRVLDTLEANDNVIITTPTEILTGDKGIYKAKTNMAEMLGNVVIKRGPNILKGEKAQVDLNTNISTMFGSTSGGGRVSGVFYPGSEKKPD